MASVGSWIVGSGTVSTRTSRLPCQTAAFMTGPFVAVAMPTGHAGQTPHGAAGALDIARRAAPGAAQFAV